MYSNTVQYDFLIFLPSQLQQISLRNRLYCIIREASTYRGNCMNGLFFLGLHLSNLSKNLSHNWLTSTKFFVKSRHNSNFTENLSNQMRYYILSLISRKNSSKQIFDFIWLSVSISRKIRQIMKYFSCFLLISRKRLSDDIAILWGSRKTLIPLSYLFSWKMQLGRYEHPHYYNFLKMSNAKFW